MLTGRIEPVQLPPELHEATNRTAHGERERARFFGANTRVPLMVIAVGDGQIIARLLPELGTLLPRPLVTLERVRVCKTRRPEARRAPRLA